MSVKPVLTIEGHCFNMPECNDITRFKSQKLPTNIKTDGIYLPDSATFPAIDFIWKQDCTVWGVQVHVAVQRDVVADFASMCREARWLKQFKHIYLLYLSPEQAVTDLVKGNQHSSKIVRSSPRLQSATATVNVKLASRGNLTCLDDLNWPARCSL